MTQLEIRTQTLQDEMQQWGENYRAAVRDLNTRNREAYEFSLRWSAAGTAGDFSTALAHAAGMSRTTAWRAWRAGMALALGCRPDADQGELVDAARALDNGASLEEVNTALEGHTVRDLAIQSDVGHVGRRMTAEAAELRQQVQQRLGTLGLEHVSPAERDELVYRAFLSISDETVAQIIQAYRNLIENEETK